jgi:nucleotide-binding universal stress UspA family protein
VKSIEVCEGFPAEVILSKADKLNCDAIVMGTHGKGIIANTFLGSTSKRVLRRTRKPVFIIPLPKGELDITFHDF